MCERSNDDSVSPEVLARIHGRERLIQHFGSWPRFHDAEIIAISLERAPWLTTATKDLRATFYVYDLSRTPQSPLRKQTFVEILFEDIDDLRISHFDHQNPITDFSITSVSAEISPQTFEVEWGGVQHEVSFSCSTISVLRVIDLNPFQKSIPSIYD